MQHNVIADGLILCCCSIYNAQFSVQIYKLSLTSARCMVIHRLLPIECICAFTGGKEGDKLR